MTGGDLPSWSVIAIVALAVLLGLLLLAGLVLLAWRLGRAAGRGGDAAFDMRKLIAAAQARERRLLAAGFADTLKRLRAVLPGPGWRYAAPWVLLLGAERSGRSSLAAAIDLHRPFPLPADRDQAEHGCVWHVFEPGLVLEPAGPLLWGDAGDSGDSPSGWRRLMNLLLRHRRERGIDGVVITVSAAELLAADPSAEIERARALRERLRELQQYLGLRVPVYLVVTKCDAVAGFGAFWQDPAAGRGRQMVGWSNDETPETAYAPNLIARAFDELGRGLHRILLGQAVHGDGIADQAFLFPAEFQRLAAPVGRFADILFHVDAYQDPHFFRGVYFTGDVPAAAPATALAPPAAGEEPAEAAESPEAPASPEAAAFSEAIGAAPAVAETTPAAGVVIDQVPPRLLFVTDLFAGKVFPESRLVQPVRQGMAARGRSMRLRWTALALAALVLAVGSWFSYWQVRASANQVIYLVNQIRDTREGKDPNAVTLIKPVLDVFHTVGRHGLVELFLPASWFSPLETSVRKGLVDAFEIVVLHPMWFELIKRTEALLSHEEQNAAKDPADVVGALKSYIAGLDDLADLVKRYEQANKLQPDDLAELIRTLLNIDSKVGDALRSDKQLYAEVMGGVDVPPFEIGLYAGRAYAILARLAQAAARTIEAEGGVVGQFRELAEAIRATEAARLSDPLTAAARLKTLEGKLRKARELLNATDLGWRFVLHPENEPYWAQRMKGIRDNPFLGEAAAAEMLQDVSGKVGGLRAALLAIRVPETGPLLVAEDKEDGRLRLAPALEALAQALPPVLAYDFFSDPARQPVRPFPRTNLVLWSPDPLERAVAYEGKFKEMEAGPLLQVPESLRPMIKAVAAQSLQGAMLSAVADAEVLEKRGADFRQFGDDETLLREARQFGRAGVALAKVLEALQKRGFDQAHATVADIVGQHALAVLEQADHLVDESGAWMPVDKFRGWDGVLPMNFEGYQVLSDPELDQYLKSAAARIDWLASEIAKPVVGALQGEAVPAPVRGHPRMVRWLRIIKDLERYKAANPASTLAALERFIRVDLAAIKPGACPDLAGAIAGGGGGGSTVPGADGIDFFYQRLQTVRQFALAQCQQVAGVSVKADFDRVAADFNETLAGRYPFADPSAADIPEASPDAITGFFERFTPTVEAAIRRGLGTPGAGRAAPAALLFVDRLATVRDFLAPLMLPSTTAPAALEIEAEFRVNRQRESGGNQIIEWTLALDDQRLSRGGEAKAAKWRPGDPVSLKLRWAKNAPVTPVTAIGGNAVVDASRALVVSYDNQWGLIRLLQNHRAPATDLPGRIDRQPLTLKFSADTGNVPVAGATTPAKPLLNGRTAVFVRVSVLAANPDGKTRKLLALPVFPFAAPRLNPSLSAPLRLEATQ